MLSVLTINHNNSEISFLEKVVHETEARCPVYNLIKDAGVKIETVWVRRSQN